MPGPDGPLPDDSFVQRLIPEFSPQFHGVEVAPGTIPVGLELKTGDPRCDSIQPLTFYAEPTMSGMLPRPEARRAEVLERWGRLVGNVLMFAYGPNEVQRVRAFLSGHLWGDAEMPTSEHPEDFVVAGSTLLILCFDPSDPAGDWYRDRLRMDHHVRVASRCPELYKYDRDIAEAGTDSPMTRAAIAKKHEAGLLSCSFGAVRIGTSAKDLSDWPRAEFAFRRALELDAQGDALTTKGALFFANYSLALAISMQGRATESIPIFERALDIARSEHNRYFIGWATYNLACALSEAGRFDEAAPTLERAIHIDPSHRPRARRDRSFYQARKLPAFKRLLR